MKGVMDSNFDKQRASTIKGIGKDYTENSNIGMIQGWDLVGMGNLW